MSSSTYRGERMGRKQISTSFGKPGCKSLEKVTLDQPCWGLRPGPLALCLAPSSPAVHRSYQEETRAQKGKGPHSGREFPAYQEVFESPTLRWARGCDLHGYVCTILEKHQVSVVEM